MTPEIRARCEQWLVQARCEPEASDADADADGSEMILHDLESLYREAMAAGLEMAATESVRYQGILSNGQSLDYNAGFHDGSHHLMQWCRREAQRVKEGTRTRREIRTLSEMQYRDAQRKQPSGIRP